MRRTIVLHIGPNKVITDTVLMFNECTNFFLQLGFDYRTYSKRKLQSLGYYEARGKWPRLQSSLVQGARDCASEMLKREKLRTLPVKKSNSSARFNGRTFSAFLDSGIISLTTVDGRKKIPVSIPDCFEKYKSGRVVGLRIRVRKNRIILDLIVEIPMPHVNEIDNPKVIGVDRGINNIAVTSDGEFFNSRHLRKVRSRYAYNRKRLQSVGTPSAKRKLKRLSGRERRFQTDVNHCISKRIVENADVVVLEDLSIKKDKKKGKRFNRKLGRWAYAQLESFVKYKAEAEGKTVLSVPPEYTSKMCSQCGNIGVRRKHSFRCTVCGFELNSDLNGARNIAHLGNALMGRFSVNEPIVTINDGIHGTVSEISYKPPNSLGGN